MSDFRTSPLLSLCCLALAALVLPACKDAAPADGPAKTSPRAVLDAADALIKQGKVDEALAKLDGLSAPADDPAVTLVRATAQLAKGDLVAARALMQKASELDPKNAFARGNLAMLAALDAPDAAAIDQARKLAQDFPELETGPCLLGLLAMTPEAGKDAAGAIERYRAKAGVKRGDAEVLHVLSDLALRDGDAGRARTLSAQAQRAKVASVLGAFGLGRVAMRVGRRELAERLFQASAAGGENAPALAALALVASDLGHHDVARDAVKHLEGHQVDPGVLLAVKGREALARGMAVEAAKLLEQALASRATSAQGDAAIVHLRMSLAQAYTQSKELEKAKQVLLQVTGQASAPPSAKLALAANLAQLEDTPAALKVLAEAMAQPATATRARAMAVQLHVDAKRFDEALALCEQWLQAAPDHPPALVMLGTTELLAGKREQGLARLRAALAKDPGAVEALGPLVDEARSRGETGDALVEAQLELRPDDARLLDFAGQHFQARKLDERAEDYFRRALKADDSTSVPWVRLGNFYKAQGAYARALPLFQEALERAPMDLPLLIEVAHLEASGGAHADAIGHYEQALARGVQDAQVFNNLAYLYAKAGQKPDEALQLAQRALALQPDDPSSLDTLGWIQVQRKDHAAALPLLERAVAAQPKKATYRFHLALAQLGSGQEPAGRESLKRSLELDPRFDGADQARALLEQK